MKKTTSASGSGPNDRLKILEQRLKQAGIKNTKGKIKLGSKDLGQTIFIPTGQPEIDSILGEGGGIPEGSVVEFCGESQSGKTYLALKVMAQAQERKKICAFMNVENTFYPPRAITLGVNLNDEDGLFELYENLGSAELYGDFILSCVASGDYGVIVVDSISALVPEVEKAKGLGDNPKIGAHALFINRFLKKLVPLAAETGTIVILINQFRLGAGAMPNSMVRKATGGAGMDFFCHMRLWINKINGAKGKILGSKGQTIGGKSKVQVMKTRYGQPWLEIDFPIMFTDGDRDPINEFLTRATDKYNPILTLLRKEYRYIDKSTGEVLCSSKDQIEFLNALVEADPQSEPAKNDTSTNGFEYVCHALKLLEKDRNDILTTLEIRNNMVYGEDQEDDLVEVVEE